MTLAYSDSKANSIAQELNIANFYLVNISADGVARLGGSYTLNCTVIGVTSEDIFYKWSGPGTCKTSSELTISSIGFQNAGTYTCSATIGNFNITGEEDLSIQSELLHFTTIIS